MKTVVIFYESDCGGETNATKNISTQLKKDKKLKITEYELQKLQDTSFSSYFRWVLISIYNSLLYLHKYRPQTVYTITFTAAFAAIVTKKLYNHKVVFHYHGNRIPEFSILPSQFIKWFFTYLLHRIAFKNIDALIVPSEFSQRYLGSRNLKSHNTHIISNGVDFDFFYRYSKQKILAKKKTYNLNAKKIIVSYVGRLVEKKGIEKLLYLLLRLQQKYDIVLLLAHPTITTAAGKKYAIKLLQIIKKKNLYSSVQILENQNVTDIYNISDLVVSLSEEENFPLILLESYACKTKFVTSNPCIKKIQEELYNSNIQAFSWEYISKKINKLL